MNEVNYELRLKVLFNKVATINWAIEQYTAQYDKATTDEEKDMYKQWAIMTEGSYNSAKLELITLISENNQN
jgi:hypothetical protein